MPDPQTILAEAEAAGQRLASDLEFVPYNPRFPERIRDHGGDCFAAIRQKDLVVHHPYESFDVVVQFLQQAARDPDVVAIKQTLYRTIAESPIVEDACRSRRGRQIGHRAGRAEGAFRRGSQHPLGARSRARRRAGRLRLHRIEDPRQAVAGGAPRGRRARDLCSCRHRQLSSGDRAHLYRSVVLHRRPGDRRAMWRASSITSPVMPSRPNSRRWRSRRSTLRQRIRRSHRAGNRQRQGRQAGGDLDEDECAGRSRRSSTRCTTHRAPAWPIDLVVRGICCLRPGVPGLSDNIRVKSIVGRFLEHGRIYCFGDGHVAAASEGRGLYFLGRHDAAQPRPPGRGAVPDSQSDRARAGSRPDHGRKFQG